MSDASPSRDQPSRDRPSSARDRLSSARDRPCSSRDQHSDQDAWAHWEATRRELLAITDRIALPPADRSDLLTALDRSHAALAAWLVTAYRPTEDSQLQR